VIGRSLPRTDAVAKAAGAAIYPQDLPAPPGCLYLAAVRAPVASARLHGIDAAPALEVPGVVRVLTARDVRGTNRYGLAEADQQVLVSDRVRGASDVLALVVGRTQRAAREGARRVGLDLSVESPLVDFEHACDADAPIVHPERTSFGRHANIVAEEAIVRGDVDAALVRADTVIEAEYRTGFVEHAFLAPEAGLAEPAPDGRLTLFVATQWPQEDLRQAARALGEPVETLRLVQQTIGGAFGGREDVSLQLLLLLAARAMNAPVRMVWDRAESIRGHGKRHPFRIRHALGADRRGRLLAARIDVLADAGCYASTSGAVLANAMSQACGPYAVAHVRITGRAVYTNNPYTCAFRGFGVNQVTFAMEQQLNKLAHALGVAPDAIRRRNFVREGGQLATGPTLTDCTGLEETLSAATARARQRSLPRPRGDWRYGRGLASALKNIGCSFGFDDHATARVTVTRDGATVWVGVAEVGQGAETVLVQIAAEALAVAPQRVRVEWRDTATAPEAGSASASHQTFVPGNAVRLACEQARRSIERLGGTRRLPPEGLTTTYTFHAASTDPLGHASPRRHSYAYAWSTCLADVGVDVATGQVRLLRVVNALDAGRVINPKLLEGQVEGGVVMGQGYALQERFPLNGGMPVAGGLLGCNLPTAVEAVPLIETVAIEGAESAGPYGARGIGEITMIPVVPAITAAIQAATGVWVDEIPVLPEGMLAALDAARAAESPRWRRSTRGGPSSSMAGPLRSRAGRRPA
jgi:CO/xanthine dehydrogenase Mo-binding subunit